MDEQTLSALRLASKASSEAAKIERGLNKQAGIRMMASTIYGHLYEDKCRGSIDTSTLVEHSVEIALAIWQEVDEKVPIYK